jgi:hypothetical protein
MAAILTGPTTVSFLVTGIRLQRLKIGTYLELIAEPASLRLAGWQSAYSGFFFLARSLRHLASPPSRPAFFICSVDRRLDSPVPALPPARPRATACGFLGLLPLLGIKSRALRNDNSSIEKLQEDSLRPRVAAGRRWDTVSKSEESFYESETPVFLDVYRVSALVSARIELCWGWKG